jgi:hypothetical protein
MNLRTIRRLTMLAIVSGAILAGGPATLAAASSAATPALAGHANVVSAVSAARTARPLAPGPWTYYSNYPTLRACNGAGDWLWENKNIFDFKCEEVEGYQGDFFVWNLYFRIA